MKRSPIKQKTTRKCKEHGEYLLYSSFTKCPQCLKEKQNDTNRSKNEPPNMRRHTAHIMGDNKPSSYGSKNKASLGNGISKRSAKKQEEDRKVAAIKANLIKEHGLVCQSTGKHGAVELSHIIPRSLRPDLITNPINCMIQCHEAHEAWEHKVMNKVAQFKNLGDIMKRLKQLDYGRYEKIINNLREHSI